ncbi:MAG: hypothetical protein F9B45_32240, partial [Phycisphaera sp. RhM]|nr:hypothetical protein [Phycisphaera sp. RhM]
MLEARRLLAREVSGTLAGDDDWSGTIHVTGDVTVPAGSKLTIQPDTVVKFETGKWLTGNGAIEAVGSPGQPIVFTSALDDSVGEDLTPGVDGVPYPGHWESLYLAGAGNLLQNVEVRYAGDTNGDGQGGGQVESIRIDHPAASPSDQTQLNDVRIIASYSNGLHVLQGAPTLQSVDVSGGRGYPYYFDIDASPNVSSLTASGNLGGDRIVLQTGNLTEDRSWDYGDLPLHMTDGSIYVQSDSEGNPVTLSIAAGTVIKMTRGRTLLTPQGAIQAVGTLNEPIIFTAATDDSVGGDSNGDADASVPYPGYWQSIYLTGPNNVLENVEVRYAGDLDGNGVGGGQTESIRIDHVATDPATEARLTNVRVTNAYSTGVHVLHGSPTLQSVNVVDGLGYGYYFDIDADPITSGLSASGNLAGDRIVLQTGDLTENRTWDYGSLPLHWTDGSIYVRSDTEGNPVTLSIAPGTVIKMPRGRTLLTPEGTLNAVGTPAEPIVFTAANDDSIGGDSDGDLEATVPYPGYWQAIYLNGPGSVLENVEVRYAGDIDGNGIGSGQVASIHVNHANTDPTTAIQLKNVRISNGYSTGVDVNVGTPILETVHVENSLNVPFYFDIDADPIVSGLTGRGNAGGDRIVLQSGTLKTDRTWDYGSLPLHLSTGNYVVGDSNGTPATLTIAAGTVVKMPNAYYMFSDSGAIQALGTAAEPIVFTAHTDDSIGGDSNGDGNLTAPYPGYWESIYLDGPRNNFENVEIRYAGDTDGNGIASGQVGSLELRHAGNEPATQTRLTNVRISEGYSNGINLRSGDPVLQNIHAQDNFGVPFYFELDTDPQTSGLSGRGNLGGDQIAIQSGTLTENRSWDYGDLPIHLTAGNFIVGADTQSNPATLTIAAGTVIKMPNAYYFESRAGTIHAVGTENDPIVFTAATDDTVGGDSNRDRTATKPYPGYWESLYLIGPSNVLEHVDVRYAGDTDGNGIAGGQVGSIELYHDGSEPETQSRLSNVSVSYGYSNGVNVREAMPTLENVHAFRNIGAAYYFELDAAPSVTGLTGDGNTDGDRIAIQSGTLTQSRVWDYGELPIHIINGNLTLGTDSQSTPANLEIAAGTVIKIDQANYVWARDGALRALGTPTEPIYFTAASDDT